jgi:outer membrane protein assembly factor BamD
VSAPSGAADPNAVVKPIGPTSTALPAVEKPAEAPLQANEIKPGTAPTAPNEAAGTKHKKPKTDLSDESSSKKKKKKGLGKINPF